MKTLRNVALTYLFLLALTLFVLLLIPRAYSAYQPNTDSKAAPALQPTTTVDKRLPSSVADRRLPTSVADKPIRSTSSCRALVEEMNQMKKAQNQIITSLAQNHDIFADQLTDLSFELSLYRKTIPQKALNAMEKSAQAYHIRATKAQQTAQSLESLTTDLIARIQACLK